MLLILNLPLIGLWVRILKVPYPILFPLILLFCLIGAYSLNNSVTEVLIMVGFGLLGYLFKKFEYEAAPLILALVLGTHAGGRPPPLPPALGGEPLIFVTRPISGVLMLISFFLLAYPLVPWLRRKRAIIPR